MTGLWNRVAGDATLLMAANVLLQVTLLTGLGLTVVRLFRHNATVRHCVLVSVLLAALFTPVLTVVFAGAGFSLVAIPVVWDSADTVPSSARTELVVIEAEPETDVDVSFSTGIDASDVSALSPDNDDRDRAQAPGFVRRDHARSVVTACLSIWLLGTLVALFGIARSGWSMTRIVRGARPLTHDGLRTVIHEVFRTLGVKSLPHVACSPDVAGPTVGGIVRPVLILPTRLIGVLGTSEMRHVLLHETAHVLRRDQFVVVLQQMLGAVFWPHPLVHLVNRQLARAREEVCDNYVLSAVAPADYGETLLRLGQLMPVPRPLPAAVGIFNRRWKLEDRIADLLDKRRNTMIRMRPTFTVAVLVAALILSVGIAGSKIGRAAAPPSGQKDEGKSPDNVAEAAEPVDTSEINKPEITTLPDHLNVKAVAFSADGKTLISVATEKKVTVRFWDVKSAKLSKTVTLESEHHGNLFLGDTLRLSADGKTIFARAGGELGLWDAETGKLRRTLNVPLYRDNQILILAVAISRDGGLVACGGAQWSGFASGENCPLFTWNTRTGKLIKTLNHDDGGQLNDCAYSPDGALLASATTTAATMVWETEGWTRVCHIKNYPTGEKGPHLVNRPVSPFGCALAFSPDSRLLAVGDLFGVKLYDARTGKHLRTIDARHRYGHDCLFFSPDGRLLGRAGSAARKSHWTVFVWDVQTGKVVHQRQMESNCGAFSPNSRMLAVGFSDRKAALKLWRLPTK